MSGTILVGKKKSADVRTVDFLRIVDALRSRMTDSPLKRILLETLDEGGLNLMCADDLDEDDFAEFFKVMKEVRTEFKEDPGLEAFLDQVLLLIESDERIK